MCNGHVLAARSSSSSLIVIEEGCRFREGDVVEHAQMAWCRHPVAVRRLLVEHEHERTIVACLIYECKRLVCYHVGDIALLCDRHSVFHEFRCVVVSLLFLSADDAPEIKALRLGNQMPLTHDACRVACLLEELRKGLLRAVKLGCIVGKSVHVTEFTCENACP